MVWGPLISAGASLIGGLVSARGAERAANRSEAFSREMYDYALTHGPSLEMAGLRRAGINPMLRYGTGGQGTPVSMPTMSFQNPLGDLGAGIAGAASSAFGTMRTQQEIAESQARTRSTIERLLPEIARVEADTSLTQAQRETELHRPGQIMQDIVLSQAQAMLAEEQFDVYQAQIRNLDAGAFAQMTAAYLNNARARRENELGHLAAVEADRAVSQWFHDQQMYDDEVVGFTLRALRAVSSAVFGRD